MKVVKLQKIAKDLRKIILDVYLKRGGHLSTSLSCIDILVALHFANFIKLNKKTYLKKNRNLLVVSKGHSDLSYYSLLYYLDIIDKKTLYNQNNKIVLGGHLDHKVPGVELTTGSLGHGLGFAAGISLAEKINKKNYKQFVLLGDAECSEGSIWEAALFAKHNQLNNLVAIIDKNSIGASDYIDNFTSLTSLKEKWISFGWNVIIVNGHNFQDLIKSFKQLKNSKNPTVIIANTIKGKGIKFMQNDPIWHVKKLENVDDIQNAKKDIDNYE